MDLGSRIRALRKEHGLSLEELAQKSSVALATLSRLENGKGSGTFRTHRKIADALGLAITELYKGFDQPQEEAVLLQESDSGEAESFTFDEKASALLLTTQIARKRMLPQMLILQPDGKTSTEQYRGGTERWVFGLEGEIEVKVADKSYSVAKGGTLYFKASLPHQFHNKGKSVARCILVTSPVVL